MESQILDVAFGGCLEYSESYDEYTYSEWKLLLESNY